MPRLKQTIPRKAEGRLSRRLARNWPASPSLPPSLLPGPSTLPHAGTPDYKTFYRRSMSHPDNYIFVSLTMICVELASRQDSFCCFCHGRKLPPPEASVPTLTIQHSKGNRQGSWQCGRGHADSWSHEPRGQEGKSSQTCSLARVQCATSGLAGHGRNNSRHQRS